MEQVGEHSALSLRVGPAHRRDYWQGLTRGAIRQQIEKPTRARGGVLVVDSHGSMLSKKDFAGTSEQDRFKISVRYATLIQGLNPFKGSTHMILLVRISILQFLCGDFFDSIGHAQRAGRLVNQSISDGSQAVTGAITVLALDMYEHAYHLDFGANSRLCGAFMRNIDWSAVQGRYEDAVGVKRPRPLEQKQLADLPSVMVDEVQAMLESGALVQIIDTRPGSGSRRFRSARPCGPAGKGWRPLGATP